ncbi:MAG: CHAT domain-containing protein [Oscillatoria sp. SIO1A7]|nr:CHAT domain-containing protein [Oscillatoria sp. SIO1A7]
MNAEDIVARTAWQLGRILKQKGERNKALSAYRTSFNTLQDLRGDLVAINPDVQFDFKEGVEPVYREFVGLLLQGELKQGTGRPGIGHWALGQGYKGTRGPKERLGTDKGTQRPARDGQGDKGTKKAFPYALHPRPQTLTVAQENGVTQDNLQEARLVIEALQLAELDNFFREACLEAVPQKIDDIDPTAAVIYPIILSDRLEVIVSLANRPLLRYTTRLPRQEVQRILQEFHSSLHIAYSDEIRLALAEQIYKWLIQPAEAELASGEIKTLVFVLDGFFRSIPMAALYDGEQYLVQKYGIALSPGLQLFPEGLERKTLSALAVGLTEARQGFSALPEVAKEVKQIAAEVKSKVLLNREFTRAIFTEEVNSNPTSVVHLATHGQFSSNPEETFLLAWDDRIRIRDFDRLFYQRQKSNRSPVELLVLSACQTATGDRRATLGLAGFALRSGARSTLATLWSVNDRSTADLMSEFYQELTEYEGEINKAQALRDAQLKLLQNTLYNHPYFWAPFVLVGNWL